MVQPCLKHYVDLTLPENYVKRMYVAGLFDYTFPNSEGDNLID